MLREGLKAGNLIGTLENGTISRQNSRLFYYFGSPEVVKTSNRGHSPVQVREGTRGVFSLKATAKGIIIQKASSTK